MIIVLMIPALTARLISQLETVWLLHSNQKQAQ